MNRVPLPTTWTALRSSAALVILATQLTRERMTPAQLDLLHWELAKYGPCFHEPDTHAIVDDAIRLLEAHMTDADLDDPRELGRVHASVVLYRRGRQWLDHALSAATRVASMVRHDRADLVTTLIHDATTHAVGVFSIEDGSTVYHLGPDEVRDPPEPEGVPSRPDRTEIVARMKGSVAVLETPPGWSRAFSYSFLMRAAMFADCPRPNPPPDVAIEILGVLASQTRANLALVVELAERMLRQCEGRRFVLLRAFEDQLMHFASAPLEDRQILVRVIDAIARERETSLRRALASTAMAVLATSPNALPRNRTPPARPSDTTDNRA